MNAQEAEIQVVLAVKRVDAVRLTDLSKEEKDEAIALIEIEIKELKKITGPRHITGVSHR